jgi:DNA-binding winged helix-turn-helix (wHTH) protein
VTPGGYRFEDFVLDPQDRRLSRGGATVELSPRYLDALTLLVREQGRLVTKDRFMDEVWRGVPVTDEALTQCIRTLRRQLGDDAARPRFIETAPKHGYRFIAPVEATAAIAPAVPAAAAGTPDRWRLLAVLGGAGTLGGGAAGLIGGLVYGLVASPGGMGGSSVLLVLVVLTALIGLLGGAGVAFGMAATGLAAGRPTPSGILGGAGGGMIVGGFTELLGLDAFNLLVGRSPADITGGFEGALLGGAIGLGAWLGSRAAPSLPLRRSAAVAGLSAGIAGALIPLLGGRMMGGSLDLLARAFPGSRLRLDHLGALFGEAGFGPIAQSVTAGLEGMSFGACVVAAMILAHRRLNGGR